MRIAFYGGSFDPPHVGHGLVASWLLWTDRADEVWMVPAAGHPFGKDMAPFAERLALCEAVATVLGEGVRACGIEGQLPRPSYTLDTLEALEGRHPEHRFRIVVGSDNLAHLPRWKRSEVLLQRYALVVVGRQGYPGVDDAPDFPAVSSTDIRARARDGRPIDHLVPKAIEARVRRLYGEVQNGGP